MSAKDVIIALDFPTREETLSFLDQFPAGEKPFVKIGMELFYAEGPQVVRDIKARGHKIFLDLKLHDIPNTVKRAMAVLSRLDVDMVNLHAAGTSEMMRAALEGLTRPDGTRPLLIAVTQLTSTDAAALKNELLIDTPMAETVLSYAKNAAASGLDGVVCSPLEAALVKERCGADFLTVTPGIRFADSAAGDQKRIMTPEKAGKSGCDYIVVGRPITQAEDPVSAAQALAAAYWPGPLTMILPKSPAIPEEVSAGLDTVAVRMPSHPLARAIIQAAGVPLAAPSANLSGSPSPTTAQHVLADMAGRIQAVVDGGPCSVGVESTVVTLASPCPRLLRPGGITPEQLRAVLGKVEIDRAVEEQLAVGEKAASPGMKYKHYAPKAHVVILRGPFQRYAQYVNNHAGAGVAALCYEGEEAALHVRALSCGREGDPSSQAQRLFDALRSLDAMGIHTAYARCPEKQGVGLAVYNRLLRAAAFEMIDV